MFDLFASHSPPPLYSDAAAFCAAMLALASSLAFRMATLHALQSRQSMANWSCRVQRWFFWYVMLFSAKKHDFSYSGLI